MRNPCLFDARLPTAGDEESAEPAGECGFSGAVKPVRVLHAVARTQLPTRVQFKLPGVLLSSFILIYRYDLVFAEAWENLCQIMN